MRARVLNSVIQQQELADFADTVHSLVTEVALKQSEAMALQERAAVAASASSLQDLVQQCQLEIATLKQQLAQYTKVPATSCRLDVFVTAMGASELTCANLSRVDPHLELSMGGQVFKSHPAKKTTNPRWGQTFHFSVQGVNVVHIEVIHGSHASKHHTLRLGHTEAPVSLGVCEIDLFKYPYNVLQRASLPLHGASASGTLHVAFRYEAL